MQIKVKNNAHNIFFEKEMLRRADEEHLKIKEFLEKNSWLYVFYHGEDKDQEDLLVVSQYENWRKYNIPSYCFNLSEYNPEDFPTDSQNTWFQEIDEEYQKEKKAFDFMLKSPYIIIFFITIVIISVVKINENSKEKIQQMEVNQEIEKEISVIEQLSIKQQMNIDKIWANFETQKVIRSQIKELEIKLDEKINEVRVMELENANIREQMIAETQK